MQSINIPLITRLKLNTWEPYSIRYPIPFFDTKNSPIITPIKDILTFILTAFIIELKLPGNINLNSSCDFVAPNDFIKLILFLFFIRGKYFIEHCLNLFIRRDVLRRRAA